MLAKRLRGEQVEVILSWPTCLLTSGPSWDSPDGTGWSPVRAWHNHPASLPSYCGSSSSLAVTAQTLRHRRTPTTTTTTYKLTREQWATLWLTDRGRSRHLRSGSAIHERLVQSPREDIVQWAICAARRWSLSGFDSCCGDCAAV